MYKIKYSFESYLQIDNFINSYKQYFKKLYLDSGLYDEEVIIKNYYYVGDKLYLKIKTKIENTIGEKVIGKHLKDKGIEYIIITINNFRLFIYYSDDDKRKIRYIENIKFFKK